MKQLMTLFSLILISTGLFAQAGAKEEQAENIHFFGKITEISLKDSSERPIDGVWVEVWADGKMLKRVQSANRGKYLCELPYHRKYTVKYGSAPFVMKVVEVDIDNFEDEASKRYLKMNIDITLFKDENFMGLDFMKKIPVAKAEYSRKKKTLVWDTTYHEEMMRRIKSVLHAYGK